MVEKTDYNWGDGAANLISQMIMFQLFFIQIQWVLLFVTYSDVSINLILGVSTNRMNVYSRKYRPWLLWIAINVQQSSRNDKVDIHIIQQQFSSIVAANYVEN